MAPILWLIWSLRLGKPSGSIMFVAQIGPSLVQGCKLAFNARLAEAHEITDSMWQAQMHPR